MSDKYKLSEAQVIENKYKLAAHSLLEKAKQQNCSLIGISTSLQIKNEKETSFLVIAKLLQHSGVRLAVVNMDEYSDLDKLCKDSGLVYVSDKQADLLKLKAEYELVLVNLPPLKLFADAVIAAQKCDGVILMERYTHTRHYQFDALLSDISANKINLLGVIANK